MIAEADRTSEGTGYVSISSSDGHVRNGEVRSMEHSRNETGGRAQDGGREQDPGHLGAASSDPRSGEYGRSSEVAVRRAPRTRGSTPRRGGASWVNWQSALYVFALGAMCVPLASLTSFWWIIPVLGAAVPLALAVLDKPRLVGGERDDRKLKERELLHALAERGDLTPTAAAMRTSLTVDEASKMLEDLTRKGHLNPLAEEGVVSYTLPERDRRGPQDAALSPPDEPSEAWRESARAPRRLEDPLSERELEVLILLASGRTNSEVAGDLFVSVGTVKSHTGNIYRKLNAKNRAEAIARARELELLS
jgi:DNA-binding CsgD family transcriptional regulator